MCNQSEITSQQRAIACCLVVRCCFFWCGFFWYVLLGFVFVFVFIIIIFFLSYKYNYKRSIATIANYRKLSFWDANGT